MHWESPPLEVRSAGQHLICSTSFFLAGLGASIMCLNAHVLIKPNWFSINMQWLGILLRGCISIIERATYARTGSDGVMLKEVGEKWPSFSAQVPFKAVINRAALNTQWPIPPLVYLCFMCVCFSQTMGVLLYLEKQASEQW